MPWYIWVLVLDLAASALWKVWKVGEYRQPITGSDAVIGLVITALYVWAIVTSV